MTIRQALFRMWRSTVQMGDGLRLLVFEWPEIKIGKGTIYDTKVQLANYMHW